MSGAIEGDFAGVVRATLAALGVNAKNPTAEDILEQTSQNAVFELRPIVARIERVAAAQRAQGADSSELDAIAFSLGSALERLRLAERIAGGEFGDLKQQAES